jgi:hypothetical protein
MDGAHRDVVIDLVFELTLTLIVLPLLTCSLTVSVACAPMYIERGV